MDCPAGTVMSRLYRGRKILQGLLYNYAVEQGIIAGAAPAQIEGATAGGAVADTVDLEAYRRQKRGGGDAE
jgi:RNA polymerase sigma-70 factor (ECF subfamily)